MLVETEVTPKVTYNMLDDPFWWDLDELEENGGPGQSLHSYLPKAQDLTEKLKDTFDAAVTDKGQAEGMVKGKGKHKGKNVPSAVAEHGKGKKKAKRLTNGGG